MPIDYEFNYNRSQEALVEETAVLNQQAQQQQESGGLSGIIGSRIARLLGDYVDPQGLGWVSAGDTEYKWPGLATTRKPDAAFVTLEQLDFPDADAIPVAPDLAVEVVSKSDSAYEVAAKALEYLAAGTRLVWIINPATRLVEVYRTGDTVPSQVLQIDGELEGSPVLPGFKLKIATIFERIPLDAAFRHRSNINVKDKS
jgi:Uma2 family endonuclease